jgi:hypothetical protein
VRLRDALDPVLKLAASLRQLLGYHVAGTGRSPIHETSGERDSLTDSKLVFRHSATFPRHAYSPARYEALLPPKIESFNPEKPSLKRVRQPMQRWLSVFAAVSAK